MDIDWPFVIYTSEEGQKIIMEAMNKFAQVHSKRNPYKKPKPYIAKMSDKEKQWMKERELALWEGKDYFKPLYTGGIPIKFN